MEALDQFTEEQKTKLERYLAFTGQNDIEVAIAALEHHSWNLERAVAAQFGDVPERSRPDESLGGLGVDQPAPESPPPLPPAPRQTHAVRRPNLEDCFLCSLGRSNKSGASLGHFSPTF
ncbi:hypothetical protein BGW42_005100, partial [Actinomortierella wolfii]